jgi:hypothetical protein
MCCVQAAADGAARAQAEAAVQRQEALASLEVAASELERVQQQLSVAQVRQASRDRGSTFRRQGVCI